MWTDFDYTTITPESLKTEMRTQLAKAGLDVDTREGSYTDLLYSAAAYQIYKLYTQFPRLLSAAIPSEASGEYLDSFASMFGLTRSQGAKATVTLTFSGVDGARIPAGTVAVSENGLRYITLEDGVITDGTAEVPAQAEEIGEAYNLKAGVITRMLVNFLGITGVTNSNAVGGADTEGDESFYQRLHTFLSEPVASGNANHYKQWARSVAGVGYAAVTPLWNGNGTVKVIVASNEKGPLDDAIVAAVAAKIEVERPIGAQVTVVSVQAVAINVTVQCVLENGTSAADVSDQLEDRLAALFLSMEVGSETPVYYNRVLSILLMLPGVVDCSGLTLNGGTANIPLASQQVPVLGEVTVTGGTGNG